MVRPRSRLATPGPPKDESFGTLIEVTNGVPIIGLNEQSAAERSMYWDSQGVFWSGGTNATGMRLP